MPSTPLRQRWSRHDRSPWTTWVGLGADHKTPRPGARLGPQRQNSQWLLPSLGEVRKKVLREIFSTPRFQLFPTSTKTSQIFDIPVFRIPIWKTPPLLSSSFEQIRVDRVRELLEALREALQQLRPPPWAITLHRKVVEDLNIILGRPLFYPPPVRWTGSASGENKALQSDTQFDVTQWLNTYDFDVWKKCNTKRVHLPSQTLLLNELSHLTSSCVCVCVCFLLRHCEKMVQVRPPKNKHWSLLIVCVLVYCAHALTAD